MNQIQLAKFTTFSITGKSGHSSLPSKCSKISVYFVVNKKQCSTCSTLILG